jgi:catechol 2,3-dioxygenase-like lactoylglutathione lyase family enzyme
MTRTGRCTSLPPMERVLGIGGIFFKAKDPKALKAWYRDHLGVPTDEHGETMFSSSEEPGAVLVWSPFPADTTYFEPSKAPFMLNFRVRNLHAMLAQLRAAGVTVDEKVQDEPYGKFGWVMDPEGNRIELWEAPARDAG